MTRTRTPIPLLLALVLTFPAAACAAGDGTDAGGVAEKASDVMTETTEESSVPDELVREMKDDLAGRLEVEASAIEVAKAEAVTWRDSSLGCPEPGMMYSQALVEGYWVILRHGGEEYDYRADRNGRFVLCEQEDRRDPLPAE